MVFCKEENREFLQSLKTLVQRDREAGEYVPPNFDSILQSLDEMSAKNDGTFLKSSGVDLDLEMDLHLGVGVDVDGDGDVDVDLHVHASTTYSPGRKEYEILQAYNSLIAAGGRPVCPLGDTYYVSKDPERYLEILVPWIGRGSVPAPDRGLDWKDIFQQQLLNWQQFRAWQQAHRDEHQSHHRKTMSSPSPDGGGGGGGSRSSKLEMHAESTRERLTHRGFTKSFCFSHDAARQDAWTTWIEYLSFECYCLDDCSRRLTGAAAPADLRTAMAAANDPAWTAGTSSRNSLAHIPSRISDDSKATAAPMIASPQHRVHVRDSRAGPSTAAKTPSFHDTTDTTDTACCSGEDDLAETSVTWMDDSPASETTSTSTSPTSRARTTDGKQPRPTHRHDAEHHNLILRWALLQEPEIAATCSRRPSLTGSMHRKNETTATPASTSALQRFKRRRDASPQGRTTPLISLVHGQDIPNDGLTELETKRCRSSAC
ncbi:hypothetical protein E4U54_002472 [Claviceps lovelessii]|nr:hypothetical protein E4U54_002472 [Claviceps lovelessii]